MMIRIAKKTEADILTKISIESKGYWGYPKKYFDIWVAELTISPGYIDKNSVFVYESDGTIIGYYSIVELECDMNISGIKIPKGRWLEHMFIAPKHIGLGLGTKMFAHLRETCAMVGIKKLGILSDPNAKGFYVRMGCEYIKDISSTIPHRTTPYLVLVIECR